MSERMSELCMTQRMFGGNGLYTAVYIRHTERTKKYDVENRMKDRENTVTTLLQPLIINCKSFWENDLQKNGLNGYRRN